MHISKANTKRGVKGDLVNFFLKQSFMTEPQDNPEL